MRAHYVKIAHTDMAASAPTFVMNIKLVPSNRFEDFLKGAIATRKSNKRTSAFGHFKLPLMHRTHYNLRT